MVKTKKIKLDKILTIAVGRDYGDSHTLNDIDWINFQQKLIKAIDKHGTCVGAATGRGVGSDDSRYGITEDTAIFIVLNPKYVNRLRKAIAALLPQYGQSSACFSLDMHHEPVFPTKTGWRA